MLIRISTIFSFLVIALSMNAQTIVTVTDETLDASVHNWTSNNTYVLDGNVFLEAGGVLNIEAGTVIKGNPVPTTGDLASNLIITKGAQINAIGTADNPIIFTSVLDDLSTTTDLTALNNQTWGGIVILGNSIVGEDGGTDNIEGIPTSETRGSYGGTDPNDNSGTLKYVSIRHGGAVLGADNEINGLTLGGVGNGTTLDYVEIFANKDDGIEFFGGTVNATHIISAFVGDDSFDYDESWDGYCQFLFSIQQDEIDGLGDNAIEYDGSEETNGEPQTTGRIYNGTFIGSGANGNNANSDGLRLKSSGSVQLWNSIFVDQVGYAYRVEGSASLDLLAAGTSAFANNTAFGHSTYVQDEEAVVIAALTAGNNEEVDAQLAKISRTPNMELDPRPLGFNAPAYSGAAEHTEGENTTYRGAFAWGEPSEKTWMHGWTALDSYGYLYGATGFTSSTKEVAVEGAFGLAVTPNPTSDFATVSYELPNASDVVVTMVDIAGRTVYNENLGFLQSGANNLTLNVANLAAGTYVVVVKTNAGVATSRVAVR